jgi:hypothetical protein
MANQPQFVPPSSPVPPNVPAGYSPPHGGYAPPPAGYSQPHPTRPYPSIPPATYGVQPAPRQQRPAVIGMSASMTATAAALWVCALATAWLLAAAGQRRLQADQDFDGQVLILLNRFSARLLDGLAVPLFGLPMIAFVAAFLLLSGRRWAQILYTCLGVVSIGWLVWWLHLSPRWAVAPVGYIAISVCIVWTPAAIRWFGRRREAEHRRR